MTSRKAFCARWLLRQNKGGNFCKVSQGLNTLDGVRYAFDLPTPFASAGAFAKHAEQSLDEHGMSRLRYSSLTIFCTFPLLVDLTNTLLEMFEAYGSGSERLRLVMAAIQHYDIRIFVRDSSYDSSEESAVRSFKS